MPILGSILNAVDGILDRVLPDKVERDKAKAEIRKAHMQQELAAIILEAQSDDAWTSRARPMFLYVVYVYVLTGIPIGLIAAFNPSFAHGVADGMGSWMASIPTEMWTFFGFGYGGYVGARSFDKWRLLKGK